MMLSLLSAINQHCSFGSIIAFALLMNKTLWLALLLVFSCPNGAIAQSDLSFLDGFVDFLTPKDSKSKKGKKVTALQKELRKTIKAVSNRYARLDDPAGLKTHAQQKVKTKTRGKRIDSAKYQKLLNKLRKTCNGSASDEELKKVLNNFLHKKGISLKPSVRIRKVQRASKVEKLRNWLSSIYGKHLGSR